MKYQGPGLTGLIAATATEVEINFVTGAFAQEFSITDAGALTTSHILAFPSAKSPSVGFHDEIDLEPFTVQGRVDINGTVILKIVSCQGKLIGRRKINYIIA